MANSHHVVHVRCEESKCNMFKLQGDLERHARCRVQRREHHRSEPNTDVFFLRYAEDVEKVMRLKEKFETKYRITLQREDSQAARKSTNVSLNATDLSAPDSHSVDESNASITASPPPQDSPDCRPSHHRASALNDVPSKEAVPLQPWELKLLCLGVLEKLQESLPGVEFTGDAKTREIYLLGPQDTVVAFKTGILNFLKALKSKEWKCSDDLSIWLGTEAVAVAHVEREFERKKICAVLSIQKVRSSKTTPYQVLVWGDSQGDVDAAILEMDAMLTSVTLTLTPELEAKLKDHDDEESAYNSMANAQGLVQITVEPHSDAVRLTGVASEVDWIKSKVEWLQDCAHEPGCYDKVTFADGEEEECVCPDLPLNLRRLLHRHRQWLTVELRDLDVEAVFEEESGSPCLRLYGSKEHCDLGQERLREMTAKVKEDEFVLPDLAIISLLDTPEGAQLLLELEDKLRVIVDVNKNRTLPDLNVISGRKSIRGKEREVERVVNDDGSYVFKLRNELGQRELDIYEDVHDFFKLGDDGDYEDPVEIQDDDEWPEKKTDVELPVSGKGSSEFPASRHKVPDERQSGVGKAENDNYVLPSSLGKMAREGMFTVQETSGEDCAQLVDSNKILHVLVQHGDLVTLTSGADAVVNFVLDNGTDSGCISSLVPKDHCTAIQEELKVQGEALTSEGLAEGDAVGELGCGTMLHVAVRSGSQKVKDAVSRALSHSDCCGHRVLVFAVQGLVDSGDADQVAQLCLALQEFSSRVPEAIKEVKLVCPDACAVGRIRDRLADKIPGEGKDEGTYGDVTFPTSDEAKGGELTDLTWDNSELAGLCNKELRNVFLRVTYMAPLTLLEVIQHLKDKFYTCILPLSLKHSSIKNLHHFQCLELFKTAGDNVLVVVQKQDSLILFLGTPDEVTTASNACKSVVEQAKEDLKKANLVEWCFVDSQDVVRSPRMEENCRWERSWRRDCHQKRPHFKVSLEGCMNMVNLDVLRVFPFAEPAAWMPLLRVDKTMTLPDEWGGSENVVELLSVGSQDYDHATVVHLLKNRVVHGHKFSLIKVERVKNARLWRQFQTMRQQVSPQVKRRRFSLIRTQGPNFHLWCDVTSAQAKDILILGLRPLIHLGPHSERQTRQHGGLKLYGTPRRAVLAALREEQLGKERVLVQVEAVAACLKRLVPDVSVPSLQNLPTCFVDSTSRPFEFLLASHVLTYPRLFVTYRLVKS